MILFLQSKYFFVSMSRYASPFHCLFDQRSFEISSKTLFRQWTCEEIFLFSQLIEVDMWQKMTNTEIVESERSSGLNYKRRKSPNWKLRYAHHSTINEDHTVISILDFRFLSEIIQDFHHRKLQRCRINLSSKHSQMIHLDNSI